MNIRWRLTVAAIQLAVLGLLSYVVTGRVCVGETLYVAGLLAIVINPQLLEPHYPRPVFVIANGLIALCLALNEKKASTTFGWAILTYFVVIAMVLAVIALVFGAGRRSGKYIGVANSARMLCQLASARVLYSAVFILAAIEFRPLLNSDFWELIIGWLVILVLGTVNWQAVWATARGREEICMVQGMIGPCGLLVSATGLPEPGSTVSLRSGGLNALGVVIARIRRVSDTWGQIHIADRLHCESILAGETLGIAPHGNGGHALIG